MVKKFEFHSEAKRPLYQKKKEKKKYEDFDISSFFSKKDNSTIYT